MEHLKGIRPRQYLYTRNVQNDMLMYAAFWPWGTTNRISVRISLFTGEEGLTQDETKKLVAAALSANARHAEALAAPS